MPNFHSKVDHLRPTYGFEDVSLAPGIETIEPNDVQLSQSFCGIDLAIPILAAAMDAVVDPTFAGALGRLGGLAVLNLEGIQTRYDDPAEILERIATADDDDVQASLSEAYAAPIQEDLVARRIEELSIAVAEQTQRLLEKSDAAGRGSDEDLTAILEAARRSSELARELVTLARHERDAAAAALLSVNRKQPSPSPPPFDSVPAFSHRRVRSDVARVVLLVEDEPLLLKTMRRMLEQYGHRVLAA